MKNFSLLFVLLIFCSPSLMAGRYYVTNSKLVQTASTTLLVLRNPTTATKIAIVKSIQLSADKAATFFLRKNADAALTGSSTVTIAEQNLAAITNCQVTASTATVGNHVTGGSALYSVNVPAGYSITVPLEDLYIPAGYSFVVEGFGVANTTVNANVVFWDN